MNTMNHDKTNTIIAVDAMGGDYAPGEIVMGAAVASLESPTRIVLVGDEAKIKAVLEKTDYRQDRIEILHSDQIVTMEDTPSEAVRKKPKSSLIMATKLCGRGKVHGMISAGNTGAYVLAAVK